MSYLSWFIGLLVLLFDQISKVYVSRSLYLGQSVPIIKNIFHVSLVHNTGIAFGLFKKQTLFFIILSLIVIVYILTDFVLSIKHYKVDKHIALGLVLGGACGNLIDRLRFGYVIDFLDFRIWPVFNIADSAITIGVILLGYSVLKKTDKKQGGHFPD